ncbi:MAG TPA: hypothetical protein PLI95_30355, partial [Polyangiaceae bacterium]|nr:hypothetical protein [Polyangiaceae bacterium]
MRGSTKQRLDPKPLEERDRRRVGRDVREEGLGRRELAAQTVELAGAQGDELATLNIVTNGSRVEPAEQQREDVLVGGTARDDHAASTEMM